MHSSVGLGIDPTKLPVKVVTPSDSLLKRWAPVLCVIADEVAMVDHGFFGLWEEALRHAKDNKREDFGGLLVVLMFDHCQLRTCSGVPMYKIESDGAPLTAPQGRGMQLYSEIKKVVYLTENMRFTQDPEWGRWLLSARLGLWTPECRAFLLARSQATPTEHHFHGPIQSISTDNATRVATNETAVRVAVRCFGSSRQVYVVPADISRRLVAPEIALLRQLPDNKTGYIPLFLHLYVGMPVHVKANQCLAKGVANGASALFHHIDWDGATQLSPQPDGTWMADRQPRNIYVNILNFPSTARFPDIPARWPASVMPVYQTTASVQVGERYVSIRGFPIVPAFGTTVHGVQGETLDYIAIANLRQPHVRRIDRHAMYVALSRVRTRANLYWIGPPPSEDDFVFFHPEPDVLREDIRLKDLSDTTVALFASTQSRTTAYHPWAR